jgi:hypothetical protein
VLLLITGASGAGKSTVRARVERALAPAVECVELRDVVPIPLVPTLAWRQEATEAVVARALERQAEGRHLLLSGDPVAAAEVVAAPSAPGLDALAVCLLDLAPGEQARRLAQRGDDPALLAQHQAFADWMRRQADDPLHMPHVLTTGGWDQMRWDRLTSVRPRWATHRIDTTAMPPAAVAEAVLEWCRRVLAGDAPVIPTA